MDELNTRIQQAAESILENEALTDNLDDQGGQTLLDWGVALAKQVAQTTEGMDETAAETAMADKLAAVRRLLRAVNKRFDPTLIADLKTNDQATLEANTKLLDQAVEQAAIILAPHFTQPTAEQRVSVVEQILQPLATPSALIASLRSFIDQHLAAQPASEPPTAEPKGEALPAEQATPATAPAVDIPVPVQAVTTDPVASIPPQPPITVGKPAANPVSSSPIPAPAPAEEDLTPASSASQPDLAWAGHLFNNLRRFLRNANPS